MIIIAICDDNLANQIDNAIEACLAIPEPEQRFIQIDIWQRESFVFFRVINSVLNNPFDEHHKLVSRKKDTTGLHGLGIKNIQDAATRYEGTLEMHYQSGQFTSLVMLQNHG